MRQKVRMQQEAVAVLRQRQGGEESRIHQEAEADFRRHWIYRSAGPVLLLCQGLSQPKIPTSAGKSEKGVKRDFCDRYVFFHRKTLLVQLQKYCMYF